MRCGLVLGWLVLVPWARGDEALVIRGERDSLGPQNFPQPRAQENNRVEAAPALEARLRDPEVFLELESQPLEVWLEGERSLAPVFGED